MPRPVDLPADVAYTPQAIQAAIDECTAVLQRGANPYAEERRAILRELLPKAQARRDSVHAASLRRRRIKTVLGRSDKDLYRWPLARVRLYYPYVVDRIENQDSTRRFLNAKHRAAFDTEIARLREIQILFERRMKIRTDDNASPQGRQLAQQILDLTEKIPDVDVNQVALVIDADLHFNDDPAAL